MGTNDENNKISAFPDPDAWKKWKGLVRATDDEIKLVLEVLKREPKDAKELEKTILDERTKSLAEIQKDANRSYW